MEWVILGLFIFIIIGLYYYFSIKMPAIQKKDVLEELKTIMDDKDIDYSIERIKRGWCDIKLETNDKIYYLKVFVVPGRQELVLNSKYIWQVNGGSTGFLFLKKVKPFVDGPILETDKETVKIAVLYSYCSNIMYYINESDMDFITPKMTVHGIKAISFDQLEEKFDWL